MATDVSKSKTEYLKRYMENESKKKRKKKTKSSSSLVPRIKILDGNIDLKSMKFGDEIEDDEDDAPVVAEVIDDRPQDLKIKELYESSRWKKIDATETDEVLYEQKTTEEHDLPPQPKTYKRHDSDSDCSPPRRPSHGITPKNSKKTKSDHSSPQRHHQNALRQRHDSDSDYSPPRQRSSPKNVKRTHGSDSDISPPRKHKQKNSSNKSRELKNSDSDISPERNRKSLTSGKEVGKRMRNSDSDLSPPRNNTRSPNNEGRKRSTKTLSGLKAGLQNATSLREETKELREREKRHIDTLDAELSGRHANTIIRDRKTGKKRDLEEENREKEEKEKKASELQQKYSQWGKGIEQTASKINKFEEDLYEASKPLARYCDDEDLDEQLRTMIHADDPMADYIRKKQKETVSTMPEYRGPPPPPNRFGIKPGYRWDGVDRSNGFEKKYFEKQSNSKAREEEAYLWSVQDM